MTRELRGGIDLGGTNTGAVGAAAAPQPLGQARRPTPATGGPPDVAEAISATLREAADLAGVATDALTGIGIGSPGEIDAAAGTVTSAGNLPGWSGSFALAGAVAGDLG